MCINRKKTLFLLLCSLLVILFSFCIYFSFISTNVYSISIYSGINPLEFKPHPLINKSPVLTASDVTDIPATFVADPFMIKSSNKWYMFFEVLNSSTSQGDIGLASSKDAINWQYKKIVLDEPFHLSYPYVFEWNNSYYMIPESREKFAVKLYRSTNFPTDWVFIKDLIIGNFADPSIVYKDKIWWLFILQGDDTLVLYYSNELTGPWIEHPMNPLVKGDKNISRPGGRIVINDNKIIRYVQDGDPVYGNSVRVFQVDSISTSFYSDHEITRDPILTASGVGWNSAGMHHIDPFPLTEINWIACVDGKYIVKDFDLRLGPCRYFLNFRESIDTVMATATAMVRRQKYSISSLTK